MVFNTPEGANGTRGCHLPPRVYKTQGPQSQRATIVLLHIGNIVIPVLEVLSSSSNIIMTEYSSFNKQTNSSNKKQFFTVPSNTRVFRTQGLKSANGGNDQGDEHWCTCPSLFILPNQHASLCYIT